MCDVNVGKKPIIILIKLKEDTMITYKVTKQQNINSDNTYISYGIIALNGINNSEIIRIDDIFLDYTQATAFAEKLNRLNLSPIHLRDVIEDIL